MSVTEIDPITLDILTEPPGPTSSSNIVSDEPEYDDLFDLPDANPTTISNAYEAVSVAASSANESGVGADEANLDTSVNSSAKCISPIQWDQDAVHVDAPEDEFSKEAEAEGQHEFSLNKNMEVTSLKSAENIEEDIPDDFDQLFVNTKYFLIKSNNHENINIAKTRNVWATPTLNESRLNRAYFDFNNVILIFSVRESGRFQGYARLSSPSDPRTHVSWVLPPRMSSNLLSNPFKLDWISKQDLPFPTTTHLTNAWNDNKPVKIGRDGQEIEPICGEALCRLFPIENPSEISKIISKIEPRKPSGNSHRRHALDRLGTSASSRSSGSGSRRTKNIGFHNSGSVGLLGAATGSKYHSNERGKSASSATPLMQLNTAAAAWAAAATMATINSNPTLTRRQTVTDRLPVTDLSRMVNSSPQLAQLLPTVAGIFPNVAVNPAVSRVNMPPSTSSTSLTRLFQGQNVDGYKFSHNGESSSNRSRDYNYRSGKDDGSRSSSDISDRNGRRRSSSNDYRSDSYRDRGSYRRMSRTRHSRHNSRGRHDDYRYDRVDHDGSQSPVNPNSFMNWNYEDYLQEVSRRFNPNLNSVPSKNSRGMAMVSSRDADRNYEERVNAFLREAGTSNSRSRSPVYSRSPSRVHDLRSHSNSYDHRYGNGERNRRSYRDAAPRSRSRSARFHPLESHSRYYLDEDVDNEDFEHKRRRRPDEDQESDDHDVYPRRHHHRQQDRRRRGAAAHYSRSSSRSQEERNDRHHHH